MQNQMYNKIINGVHYANILLSNIKSKIEILQKKHNIIPGIAVIIIGDNESSHIYVNIKAKRAKEIGINSKIYKFSQNIDEDSIIKLIRKLNYSEKYHAILIQLPLPEHLNTFKIINTINYKKDVDAFTLHNIGLLNYNRYNFVPCTPQGILMLLKETLGEDLSKKNAVVMGRSLIVGRPMATLLINENCTVTVIHSQSVNPKEITKNADILIVATGVPELVDSSWVKENACLIDVGITKVANKTTKDIKIVGDVNFDDVINKIAYITPVPGGVGPMTIACLLKNTVDAAYKSLDI